MAKKSMMIKPVAAAVGLAFVSSLAISTTVSAGDNPFSLSDLHAGYMVADADMDKEADMDKGKDGKCGEGKCGDKAKDKGDDGSCGDKKADMEKDKGDDGSCGDHDSDMDDDDDDDMGEDDGSGGGLI